MNVKKTKSSKKIVLKITMSMTPIGPPGLNPVLAGVVPQNSSGPLPVDALGRSARSVQEGGEMRGNMFVTTRGDQISRPPQGRIGGPYPKIDKVSVGI